MVPIYRFVKSDAKSTGLAAKGVFCILVENAFHREIKMMSRLLSISLLTLILWSRALTSDETGGTLKGIVVSRDRGELLSSASILIDDTKWGATANDSGAFVISSIPSGRYTIIARLLGYEESRIERVVITDGATTNIFVQLTESAIALGEIQVLAERVRRKEDVRSSLLAIPPVRAKTLAGVGEDVLRTLQALPGVLAPSDFSSQLIVRGSGPDQNLIVMDDIEVFNPYRLYGLISMFNPETASEINLITGGFPAKYGDRLSAVLDVRNREGDKTKGIVGSLNASITNANLVLHGRSPFDMNGSYVVSARRTYYDLILGPIAKNAGLVKGDVAFPNFSDIQAKFVLEPSSKHKFIANILFSRDGVEIISGPEREQPDSVSVLDVTTNNVAGLAWHYLPSNEFLSRFSFSWYRNSGDTEFGGDFLDPSLDRNLFEGVHDTAGVRFFNVEFDSRYIFRKFAFKNEMTWMLNNHTLEWGTGIDFLKTSLVWHFLPDPVFRAILVSRNVPFEENFVQDKYYKRFNLYAQDKIKVSETVTVQPGVRFDYFEILKKAYLAPRINTLFSVDPITTFRIAWGLYYQSPGYEKLLDQNTFFDLTNASVGNLRAEKAQHYVVGVERWLNAEWQVKVETYYKKFDDVIVQESVPGTLYSSTHIAGEDMRRRSGWTTPGATIGDSITTNPINGATGRSYGFEILLEKKNMTRDTRLSGWVSYALAKAQRLRNGITTPFRFDQLHTFNLVLDYKVNSWLDFGLRWRYGTNFPYTPAVGIKPRIIGVNQNGVTTHVIETDARGNVIFDIDRGGEGNKFSARLPAYHRLDIRLTAQADYWDLDWSFYLDVINVYNNENVLTYRQFINDDLSIGQSAVNMFPILPTLGFSVRF
ncbi:MAG: TonB-dependent receptor plug [Bacteroidetes bacterium]|nr:TonB-dependent receptor plug [Bacteroidota bacterium]